MQQHRPVGKNQQTINSVPFAFFITFRTYGTWLHGDQRGSVDRNHNIPGTPLLDPDPQREKTELRRSKNESVTLDASCRTIVSQTIKEVCKHREWTVHELNVRSNHVHVVLTATQPVEQIMRSLKSWSTRRLKEVGLIPAADKIWARHGSTRYLWKSEEVKAACRYVREEQGAAI